MRKFLVIILIFAMCSLSVFSYVHAEGEEQFLDEGQAVEEKDLQTQQKELQEQLQNSNQELEGIKEEISENLQQIQRLDEKITNSNEELEEVNKKIEELQASLDEIEGKLKIAEENYEKQRGLLEARLVAIYEAGDVQYLDVMLSSKNISEFLSNYFLVTELAKHDTELLEEMELKKREIEITKKSKDYQKEKLTTMKQNQIRTAKILENTKIVRENQINRLSDKEKEIQVQIEEQTEQYAKVNAEILDAVMQGIDSKYIGGELAWPVPGYTRITSKYGMRIHPVLHVYKLHTGVDIGAPRGVSFIAANDGVVIKAEYNRAYGNMVIVDHGGGVSTLYAHGSEIMVQVGQIVKRGDTVLKIGSTGYSTGPHAHFEVRLNGVVTDPMPYITNGLIPESPKIEQDEQNNEEQNN